MQNYKNKDEMTKLKHIFNYKVQNSRPRNAFSSFRFNHVLSLLQDRYTTLRLSPHISLAMACISKKYAHPKIRQQPYHTHVLRWLCVWYGLLPYECIIVRSIWWWWQQWSRIWWPHSNSSVLWCHGRNCQSSTSNNKIIYHFHFPFRK